ncbi:MAG: hypothetical protein JNL97_11675 [Verrucomicrobiales bacterium]|nr:hypothetical protein [Verrucomicrobiales bacterium]
MSNMLATLQSALELERMQREALTNQLAETSAQLAERLRLLAERESALSSVQRRLEKSETDAQKLADERQRLDRLRGEASAAVRELQMAFETTRRGADSLQERLTDTTREAAAAKARLQLMEEEMNRKREEAQAMQQRIRELDATRDALKDETFKLTTELRLTEAQADVARQEVTNLTQQLTVTGAERRELIQTASRLATNVTTLASESSAIREKIERQTEEASVIRDRIAKQSEEATAIRETIEKQTRLPANLVYADYLTNRVRTEMSGTTRGALGQEVVRRRESSSVLVRVEGQVWALLHLEQTPLRLWPPDAPWTAFSIELVRGDKRVALPRFGLLGRDPRVALIPVDDATVATLGARVYEVTRDPAQFPDAVVIGGEESYYGESAFRLSPDAAGYVHMERSTFRRLLGDFAPRRGDLAFTKTGELLGILVNGEQCLVPDGAALVGAFAGGGRGDVGANGTVIRSAQAVLDRLPAALR